MPIYKKNSKLKADNYRPVSILSKILKLFERIIYERLDKYLQVHHLLFEHQSDFRSSYSTDMQLVHLPDLPKSGTG